MMKVCLILGVFLVTLLPLVSVADNTKTINAKGVVGCLSEEALDEFMTAATNNDRRQGMELLQSGLCFGITGRPYSIVDLGFLVTEIRVYTENGSVRLFVPTRFVQS